MSKEYYGILVVLLAPMLGDYFTPDCAEQVAAQGVTWGIAGVTAFGLIAKRYLDGKKGIKPEINTLGLYVK